MKYIKTILKRVLIAIFTVKHQVKDNEYMSCQNDLVKLENFVEKNAELEKSINGKKINKASILSWVGAQINNQKLYFIPNNESNILVYDLKSDKTKKIGNLSDKSFKWTGGNVYKNKLYCFPRTSNDLLELDFDTEKIVLHDLNLNYSKEHHYGGVMTEDGFIYQPPRSNNYILKINLKDYSTHKIYIAPKFLKLRYCGSVMHPNGMIYFLPENGRVICFNPKNNHVSFIGKSVKAYCFDAKVYHDGNIYGFSAYKTGILKVNVKNKSAKMLHNDINFKSYGTKLGINGKLYSIPGDGDLFYEYSPLNDKVDVIGETYEKGLNAKCAGGCVDQFGNIYSTPTFGKYMYIIKFNNKNKIPSDLYKQFFIDNY